MARFDPDRLARLVVFGNLLGAVVGTISFLVGVLSRWCGAYRSIRRG
jgi:hypothetical protein